MISCPIDYFTDNLIFMSDKNCWALFEIMGFDYDMRSDEQKIAIMDKLTLFLANIPSEAKIMIIPVMQNLKSHYQDLSDGLSPKDPSYDFSKTVIAATQKYLQTQIEVNGRSNDYKTYIAVKLNRGKFSDLAVQAKETLDILVKSVVDGFNYFMALDTRNIRKSLVDECQKLSDNIYADLSKRIELLPVDAETTQWLLRRSMYRGMPQEVQLFRKSQTKTWRPTPDEFSLSKNIYIRPQKREMVNLFSGSIHRSGRMLRVEHDSGSSYQTFLTIANIPEDLAFPDCEWIYYAQQLKMGVEIYIHINNIEYRESLKRIDDQRRQTNSQIENINNAYSEIPADLWDSKSAIEDIEAELKAGKFPLLETSVLFCIADSDPEEVQRKASAVRRSYQDMNFIIERPLTDQMAMFLSCIPGVSFRISDFIMRLTPMAVAVGIIGATHELGSHSGMFIGTTGIERKLVFVDLREACLSNMSASTVFYGNLGVGKSFNANLLTYLHLLTGAYGLIIDPKGERTHWVNELPGFNNGLITLVTLSAEEKFRGMLDPFNIFRGSIDEAVELAINLLSELFKLNPKDDEYTALLEALNRIRGAAQPSMEKLADILGRFSKNDPLCEQAAKISRRIKLLADSGMARLLIGKGNEQAISLGNKLNILQIQNLKLPDPNARKDDYTQEENVSIVLMMVITAFCRKFVHSHPNQFKVLLFDESWMLGKTTEGEKLMSYVARMARSLYTSMILNGHSVTDLPNEGIRNTITYKFCFKTGNTAEAERMLDFMRLEKTEANIRTITNLKNAQCLFQDLNGRVGVLQFDAVFADLIKVFSTTPVDISALPEPREEQRTQEASENIEEPQPEQSSSVIELFAYEEV